MGLHPSGGYAMKTFTSSVVFDEKTLDFTGPTQAGADRRAEKFLRRHARAIRAPDEPVNSPGEFVGSQEEIEPQ